MTYSFQKNTNKKEFENIINNNICLLIFNANSYTNEDFKQIKNILADNKIYLKKVKNTWIRNNDKFNNISKDIGGFIIIGYIENNINSNHFINLEKFLNNQSTFNLLYIHYSNHIWNKNQLNNLKLLPTLYENYKILYQLNIKFLTSINNNIYNKLFNTIKLMNCKNN
jgi:hypothetical protein